MIIKKPASQRIRCREAGKAPALQNPTRGEFGRRKLIVKLASHTACNPQQNRQGADMGGDTHLVAKIVASYLKHNSLPPDQLPNLIASVHASFSGLGKLVETPAILTPAVSVRRSVQRDLR